MRNVTGFEVPGDQLVQFAIEPCEPFRQFVLKAAEDLFNAAIEARLDEPGGASPGLLVAFALLVHFFPKPSQLGLNLFNRAGALVDTAQASLEITAQGPGYGFGRIAGWDV